MKVGFDISQTAHQGGVATYTKALAHELSKDKSLEMVYFYSSLRKPYSGDLKGVKKLPIPPTALELIFNKIHKIPIETFIGDIDVFHSSDWIQPPSKAKKVTTYHDVVPLKYPEWSKPKIVKVHKKRLKIVEKEIDMVIAVSESTKRDLMEVSDIPEEKIKVIYEGVDEKYKPQEKEKTDSFRKKYNLPEKFVLAIGGVGERRNMRRIKEAARDYNLVITGETIPWLSDEEMPLLYSAARVLFYPSLYEGFGLPLLEAMACKTPVVTSNLSSMPEIAKHAALYVDPEDVKDMTLTLRTMMEDVDIRKDMIRNGILRVADFRWNNTAAETADLYKSLIK